MQPHSPLLPQFYADTPAFKSRLYVQLFSWFGLLISTLHLIEGRSLGIFQLILSIVGIYASWEDVANRKRFTIVFAVGCFIWAILDIVYLLALLAVTSHGVQNAVVSFIASNTFMDLAPALEHLFDMLSTDSNFFSIFSSITSVFFDVLATYWAIMLHNDVLEVLSLSDSAPSPLLRHPPSHANIGGFSTFSGPTASTPHSRAVLPFEGRGHRLGVGDST